MMVNLRPLLIVYMGLIRYAKFYNFLDLCPFVCSSSSWTMPLGNTCDGRVIAMIDGAPKESIASTKGNAYIFHSH